MPKVWPSDLDVIRSFGLQYDVQSATSTGVGYLLAYLLAYSSLYDKDRLHHLFSCTWPAIPLVHHLALCRCDLIMFPRRAFLPSVSTFLVVFPRRTMSTMSTLPVLASSLASLCGPCQEGPCCQLVDARMRSFNVCDLATQADHTN